MSGGVQESVPALRQVCNLGELSESFSAGYFYDSVLLHFAGEAWVAVPGVDLLLPLRAAGTE